MSELEETRTFICSHCHSDVEVDVVSAKALTKIKALERKLEKKEKIIKSFYKVRHEFLLIEIEELKNIRNKTRFPDHACKMLNNRILELERIYNLHKEKGDE